MSFVSLKCCKFISKTSICITFYLFKSVNHHDEYLKDKSDLPDELLKTVRGDDLCRDESVTLEPILDSDNQDVVQNSTRLIQKANQAYGQELRVFQVIFFNFFYQDRLEK